MFNRENVYGMVVGFGVRVKDEREQDRNHLVEVDFELPLTYDLADEIQPAMARDLFVDVAGEWQPKAEMSLAQFALAPAPQLMTIRTHPDLNPETKIGQVTLRKIQAKKAEAGSWLLKFTATWTMGEPKEVIVMIQRLKLGVYLTLQEQQIPLDLSAADQVMDGTVVNTDGQGNVLAMKPRRGRPKKQQPRNEYPPVAVTQCPTCKNEIPGSVRVCPLCGADVPEERKVLPAGEAPEATDQDDAPPAPGSDTVQ